MNCVEARDAMLAADLPELRGNAAPTPLGEHLATCAPCRLKANLIVAGTSRIGALLDLRASRPARATLPRRVALVAALPIAAAILAVASMHVKQPRTDAPSASASSLPVARHVSLTVAPGQRATVLKTADPTVTVIWLTPGEGQ